MVTGMFPDQLTLDNIYQDQAASLLQLARDFDLPQPWPGSDATGNRPVTVWLELAANDDVVQGGIIIEAGLIWTKVVQIGSGDPLRTVAIALKATGGQMTLIRLEPNEPEIQLFCESLKQLLLQQVQAV